jgi:hypothetical protein
MEETGLLLLFDANRPCWSAPLVELAGEDPAGLGVLEERKLLERVSPEAYVLTDAGRERFTTLARECYLETEAGHPPTDPAHSLFGLESILRLDQGFHSPWGSKDAKADITLSYFPALPVAGSLGELEALQGHPLVSSFAAGFPRIGTEAPRPSVENLEAWVRQSGASSGKLPLDVLFLHRYDYAYYMDASAPGDSLRLLNTDRLMIRLAEPFRIGEEGFLRQAAGDLSSLRPFLEFARRFLLPGRFDTDTQEQSSVTWWVWATRTEAEASTLQRWLAPFSDRLIGPSAPLDFWVFSLEGLQAERERHETFYELFESAAIAVARTA